MNVLVYLSKLSSIWLLLIQILYQVLSVFEVFLQFNIATVFINIREKRIFIHGLDKISAF